MCNTFGVQAWASHHSKKCGKNINGPGKDLLVLLLHYIHFKWIITFSWTNSERIFFFCVCDNTYVTGIPDRVTYCCVRCGEVGFIELSRYEFIRVYISSGALLSNSDSRCKWQGDRSTRRSVSAPRSSPMKPCKVPTRRWELRLQGTNFSFRSFLFFPKIKNHE